MDVIDVADFFISTANAGNPEEDDGITNMKLNKLLFFAQAASLQRFGKPLFDAPLEAWEYGPVVNDVYRVFRGYGRNSIDSVARPFDWETLTPEERDLLCDVYMAYARDYTAYALMRMTHQPDTPWSLTYHPHENRVISVDSIREWVEKQPLPINLPLDFSDVPVAPLDANGHAILPADWDDDDDWDDEDLTDE